MSTKELNVEAGAFDLLETNVPQQKVLSLATIKTTILAFDDTTEEYANFRFDVPEDIDTSGTVTFRAKVSPATGAASKNIGLTLGHRAVGDGEAINGSYVEEDSGAKAITATTDYQTIVEWTETITNLVWAAKDQVYARLSRDTSVANNLSGDMNLIGFVVVLPVTGA